MGTPPGLQMAIPSPWKCAHPRRLFAAIVEAWSATRHQLQQEEHMSTEVNVAAVHRIYDEIHNQGNFAAADELLTADYVDYAAPPGSPRGPESLKWVIGMLRSA